MENFGVKLSRQLAPRPAPLPSPTAQNVHSIGASVNYLLYALCNISRVEHAPRCRAESIRNKVTLRLEFINTQL